MGSIHLANVLLGIVRTLNVIGWNVMYPAWKQFEKLLSAQHDKTTTKQQIN